MNGINFENENRQKKQSFFPLEMHSSFSNQQHIIAVFFDITKTFDILWKNEIVKELKEWGVDGRILLFIQQFLTERNFAVRFGDCRSIKKTQLNGVPQGSVISPTLFNIAFSSITSLVQTPVKVVLFTDEQVIYVP